MAASVFAADEQSEHAIDLDRWTRLTGDVLADRGVGRGAEVSLLFVDQGSIAALNERFLHRQGPTDVLAFPIEDDPWSPGRSPDMGGTGPGSEPDGESPTLLGDVVICPRVAATNAAEHERSLDDEIALLVVHGVLHLLGMDHEGEVEATSMERMEQELLSRFHHPPPGGEPSG